MNPLLTDSEFLLRTLMTNLSDSIYFKDLESRFLLMNQSCCNKHGWSSPDEVVGKSDFDVFLKEHAEEAFADEQKVMQSGEPLTGIEERETWPDGSITWASTTKMPLYEVNGEIMGTFGISRDITERKEAELRARRYAREMKAILKDIQDDVAMAGELQKTFFPRSYPSFPRGVSTEESCVELLHKVVLCSDVSGDFCTVFPLSAHEVGIFQCDIGDHGVRAALGTAVIRGIMQELSPQDLTPGDYLSRMNELLMPLLGNEKSLRITASYLTLDINTGITHFASADHPVPIILSEQDDPRWLYENLAFRGPDLASDLQAKYPTMSGRLSQGDSIVFYTDGLCCDRKNDICIYDAKHLLATASDLGSLPLAKIFDAFESGAREHFVNNKFFDDICFVGVKLRKFMES